MIDFLSGSTVINPQIDFLLFLQNIRLGSSEIIDKFFLSITIFGEFWLPTLLCAITYWCIDFRAGVYLFSLETMNIFLTHFFKMLACVYRPWVLDSRIQPSALAVPYAKGYSFPSGHSAMSSSVIGGIAYLLRHNKLLCILLVGLVLMIGFSRLWLCVHTPQDVLCGLMTGLILIFLMNSVINWAESDKKRYWALLAAINAFVIFSLLSMNVFNSYRLDYMESGELLVDPVSIKYFTNLVYGLSIGLVNGCFLCRIFSPFNPKDVSVACRIRRGILGLIILIILLKVVLQLIIVNVMPIYTAMFLTFLSGMTVTLFYPLMFSKIGRGKI